MKKRVKHKWKSFFNGSWLVQCLKKPERGNVRDFECGYWEKGFGGGGSGLNPDIMKLLNRFVEFDYMGASEYEFDALAMAFGKIFAQKRYYRGIQFKVGKFQLYGIMPSYALEDVKADIGLLLEGERLKEPIYLKENLSGKPSPRSDARGWWSYTNSYLIFKDQKMYRAFLEFFQIRGDLESESEDAGENKNSKKGKPRRLRRK